MGMKSKLLTTLFLLSSFLFADSAELVGRYTGVLHHDNIKRDQLVVLDIISSNEGDDVPGATEGKDLFTYTALLKLQFGDFNSPEYVTYHYYDIRFHEVDKTLPLDDPEQKMSVIMNFVGPGKLTGKGRSNLGGEVGQFELSKEGGVPLKYPLMEPIAGEYEGVCTSNGQIHRLQSFTFRSNYDTSKEGDPFSSYRNFGNWAGKDPLLCMKPDQYCVKGIFDHGSYNFFEEEFFFTGPKQNVKCQPTLQGIKCADCDLIRISNETKEPRRMAPQAASKQFTTNPNASAPSLEDIKGVYRGVLHHEFLGIYQRAELNIESFMTPEESAEKGEPKISAVSKLYFGDFDSSEAIIYRFAPRNVPYHTKPFTFNLQRPEDDLDAVLQVEEIGQGVVRGTWYSLIYGRVGRFELRKDGKVTLPQNAKIMKPVSGFYKGKDWDINLYVAIGKVPFKSENPFFPLTFAGWTKIRNLGFRVTVVEGSYDFYTGKIGFDLSDSSALVGTRDVDGNLHLVKTAHLYSSTLRDFQPDLFTYDSPNIPF